MSTPPSHTHTHPPPHAQKLATGNPKGATRNLGAETVLQICLSFLAAKAKRETEQSDSVLLNAKGEACRSFGGADFPDS